MSCIMLLIAVSHLSFENRLRYDKVTESLKVGIFFETQCSAGTFWAIQPVNGSGLFYSSGAMQVFVSLTGRLNKNTKIIWQQVFSTKY